MKNAVLAVCGLMLTVVAAAPALAQYQVGDPVADFTLNDAYGTPVSLYDFDRDWVIWLTFWTST